MKNKICFILILIFLFSFALEVSASETCSSSGYTVLTINGIFTDLNGAIFNRDVLRFNLDKTYNNQPLFVDYLYNPTHLAGVGDLIDAAKQGLFDEKSDYDLTEMLNDASQKVTTQKILLVAHSQGNFYANNFYDKVASKEGGVPADSIGVYGVATPANKVSGNGRYLTSDTDSVIAATVSHFINILPPNIHIPLENSDGNGHSFSDVYLKYQGDKIVSDIELSLRNLQENDEQELNEPCMYPPNLTIIHKVKGFTYSIVDPVALFIKYAIKGFSLAGSNSVSWVFHNSNSVKNNLASVISAVDTNDQSSFAIDAFKNDSLDKTSTSKIIMPDEEIINLNTNDLINTNVLTPSPETNVNVLHGSTVISNPIESNSNTGGAGGSSGTNTGGNNNSGGTTNTNTGASGGGGGGGSQLDTTPPVIIVNGNNSVSVNTGTTYVDQGATASDNVDTTVSVVVTGNVNTSVAGTYYITYTATDSSGNITTTVRTVNVINSQVRTTPVINLTGNTNEIITVNSNYTDPGATALGINDEVLSVTTSGTVNTSVPGTYTISYTTTDAYGNTGVALRVITVVTYKYIPKYKFGTDNGDGRDWQAWVFNGSNVYDWSDTYVNNYLKEQFKIQTYTGDYWCSQCLQRGIFNHDPQQGFEVADFYTSALEYNPQNNMNGLTYDVVLQWDQDGYTYNISHDGIIDATGYTTVLGMNNNMWVGWDGSFNNFKYFPSGEWYDHIPTNTEMSGGASMVLQPYPVYVYTTPVLSDQKAITVFNLNGLSPNIAGIINENTHDISLTVPYDTNITNLIPTILTSDKSSVVPNNSIAQNFTSPVTYVVTAENGSTQNYTVTITIAPDSSTPPPSDTTMPIVTSYSFNGMSSDVTVNPTTSNPLSININANKNVNWMSIKIEKIDNTSIYKTFQSGVGCVDGTNTCTKSWIGLLHGDVMSAPSGTYRIKLHMKDSNNNEFYDYLAPYVIKVDTSI